MTTAKADKIRVDFGDASRSIVYDLGPDQGGDLRGLIRAFDDGELRLEGATKILIWFGAAAHIEHGPRTDLGWTLWDDRRDVPRKVGEGLTTIDACHYAMSIWRRPSTWDLF